MNKNDKDHEIASEFHERVSDTIVNFIKECPYTFFDEATREGNKFGTILLIGLSATVADFIINITSKNEKEFEKAILAVNNSIRKTIKIYLEEKGMNND